MTPKQKCPSGSARASPPACRGTPESRAEAKSRPDSRISALGSGSDYTVFIDHLGVPAPTSAIGGEDQGGGQYHSVYDDFYYYTHFQDTEFVYDRALAQTAGTMMMRMADADVLPYQFTDQADTIHTYVTEVKKLADTMRTQIKDRNADLADGVYKAPPIPRRQCVPPPVDVVPPYFNFAPLDQASDDLTAAAGRLRESLHRARRERRPQGQRTTDRNGTRPHRSSRPAQSSVV